MSDVGLAPYFVEGLFNSLNEKMKSSPFNYTIRMQYVEIVNEEVIDLLTRGKGILNAEADDWEGAVVKGAERRIIKSIQDFNETYKAANLNRINLINEFGKLSDKAAAILVLDLIQITERSYDTQVLVSKITFAESPGTEMLNQDEINTSINQETTLNQGIAALQDVALDLSSGNMANANYDGSQITRRLFDTLDGNAITLAVLNVQCEDQIGSASTMNLLKYFQRIVNFPIINDNKAIGLLHKYRKRNVALRKKIYGARGETIEKYQAIISEMNKKNIGTNLDTIKVNDERRTLNIRLLELKDKYNNVLKQKADLQEQLLNVEEEKLNLSKVVIQRQIENAKLQEEIQNIKHEYDTKGIRTEANINVLEYNMEISNQKFMRLQLELDDAKSEKKEFELELMSVKRNYLNKCNELEGLKKKYERISAELITAVNTNKSLISDKGSVAKSLPINTEKYNTQIKYLESDNKLLKEQLSKALADMEKAINEKISMEVFVDNIKLDYDKKRVALEKEYVELAKEKDNKLVKDKKYDKDIEQNKEMDKRLWSSEKGGLNDKIKELYRKLEVADSDVREFRTKNDELIIEKRGLEAQLNEIITNCRDRLEQMGQDEATTQLIRTYAAREKELIREVSLGSNTITKLQMKCRTLRDYARQLRYLCEDIFPENRMKPDILQGDEPYVINEEQGDIEELIKSRDALQIEINKLKNDNKELENIISDLNEKLRRLSDGRSAQPSEEEIRKKILEEVKMLKERPVTGSRPPSGRGEFDTVRNERNRLLEENVRLKQIVMSKYLID